MKKALFTLLIICGVFFIVAISYEALAKNKLEQIASEALNSPVTIGGLDIAPFSGTASVRNIRIANPDGFSNNAAITLPYISSSIDLKSIFSDHVKIKDIRLEGLDIQVELTEKGMNLQKLKANMDKAENTTPAPKVPAEKDKVSTTTKTEKTVEVGLIQLTNISVSSSVQGQEAVKISVRDIAMQDIGSDTGVTTKQVIRTVMDAVLRDAVKVGGSASLKAGFDKLLDGAGDIGQGLKSLFNK